MGITACQYAYCMEIDLLRIEYFHLYAPLYVYIARMKDFEFGLTDYSDRYFAKDSPIGCNLQR